MLFKNPGESGVFPRLARAVSLEAVSSNETRDLIYSAAADMVAEAEKFSLRGDLWEFFFALAVVQDENPICRAYERRPAPAEIFEILAYDLWSLHKSVSVIKSMAGADAAYGPLRALGDFSPRTGSEMSGAKRAYGDVAALAAKIASASSPLEMTAALGDFCENCGAGIFAVDCAFTWDSSRKSLAPVDGMDPWTLGSMIGYAEQKRELLANTESFLSGNPSNNVLLFGDSGTGKSSSVRALLNEPGFVRRGLRVIELRHDQFGDIPDILNIIRRRNYRFILFMDDLSFEEFEVGYKHLKALIEGGLERRPDNAVVYATSNRRNIIREVWGDRAAASDDVHGRDTMQEKQSLADRFGVAIWYPSAGKDDYLSMVRAIAGEMGLVMEIPEMEALAMRWELERGGFTGRAARQFVCQMLQRKAR
ncbi:MAG: ATP-binding protein [Synergistaceae bacterium]|nr:ATP-binding protein [Synergistaceae bacterium]